MNPPKKKPQPKPKKLSIENASVIVRKEKHILMVVSDSGIRGNKG